MASKAVYSVVAVVGIAAASGAAWWYQSRPSGPKEITGSSASAASAAGTPAGAASAPRAAGVEVAKVERTSLQDDAQSVGSLRSRQSVMMRPEVAGRVKELGFSDGARVRKGQVLVQLDDVLQRAEIRQAQAQVSIAQANLKRNQELVAQNFVAQRVLDESAANLQVVEAQLALSCARLSRMAIIAPFDGTVGIRNVNLGDYVKDGADLINLEDISSMYVDFRLPERFQGKLRPQQSVELQLDAFPGRAFKARIEAIDPLLDANGRSVGVRAVLPNTMGEPMAQGGGRPGAAGQGPAAGKPAGAASGAKPVAARNPVAAGQPARAVASGQPGASAGTSAPGRPAARGLVDANGCPVDSASAPARAQAAGGSVAPRTARAVAGGAPGAGSGTPAPLRPGMFARVTTVFSIKDSALVVPEEAIVPQGGRQFVFKVVDAPATPAEGSTPLPPDTKFVSQRQEVKLGVRRQGKVEITEGVAEGETVVLAGQQRLQRDGTALRIVELGRPPQGAASAPSGGASAAVIAAAMPATAASR
jgi:RND family efflux transporter MFP subunit